jgi:predicted DNA-binding ribbon-helix-helix protein
MELTIEINSYLYKALQELAAKDKMTVEEFIVNELEYYYG